MGFRIHTAAATERGIKKALRELGLFYAIIRGNLFVVLFYFGAVFIALDFRAVGFLDLQVTV
ncbi:MAG TPA: hypothetical protein VHK69_16260, partial [Chitinophagaceae bacterium]|nr:hypothetical protein [Chitinophagaceae bacterium]